MTYSSYINKLMRDKLSKTPNVISFGQNIATGSCLSGLTRGLPIDNGNIVINTTNSEYALTGAGFGMMANGTNGILFLKQQDFLLLGIDHLVHTWNSMRIEKITASFTIVAIVVDNGFEGPQSCINKLPDLCSISRIPGYSITTKSDAEIIVDKHLVAPGVRLIAISQNMFRSEFPENDQKGTIVDEENLITQYGSGDGATIVSLNFAFTQALQLRDKMIEHGTTATIFNVSAATPTVWTPILKHAAKTKRVVVCDDSKSQNKTSTELAYLLHSQISDCKVIMQVRRYDESWSWPNPDKFIIQETEIIKEFT